MEDERIISYRDLLPWQKGMELAERVHGVTAAFPDEGDEVAARMRDAAITIPAALSEAFALESSDHLVGVVAPIAELETCVELAKRLGFLAEDLADDLAERVEGIAQSIGAVLEEVDPDFEEEDYPGKPIPEEDCRDHHQGRRYDSECRERYDHHGHYHEGGHGPHGRGYHDRDDCDCEPPYRGRRYRR
jgi:four helix bundle protein